jgi:hypothetical protein
MWNSFIHKCEISGKLRIEFGKMALKSPRQHGLIKRLEMSEYILKF